LGAALIGTAGMMLGPLDTRAAVTVPLRKGYARGRFGQIHYRIAQPTAAEGHPPLLCFHMSPNSGRIYETFLRHMGTDRFALAPDTPGFGDSDPPPEQPGIPDYAAAMGDLIDAFGFQTVDLMGYHTGSETCVELALQRPEQVRRLVLVSAPIFTAEELAEFRAHYAREELSEDGSHLTERWRAHLYWAMDGWTPQHVAYQFPDALRRPEISWWGHAAAFSYPVAEKLGRVQQPVLVLNPEDDLHEQSLRAVGRLNNGRVHELPGWGHGFLDLFPVQAAALVRSHLDETSS
jgi:pimeloyl-ACP methyl ester carboxylesterase